ncbi:MAG: GGDEF domain-containing protein [Rhodanobacter sp.]
MLLIMAGGTVRATVPAAGDPEQLLRQADNYRTSDHAKFAEVLRRLSDPELKLSPQQRMYLLYLQGFEYSYAGKYDAAVPLLGRVMDESTDPVLRFRAGLTVVNVLGIGAHYEQAYARMNQLLDDLPHITDKDARLQALGTAVQLYSQAGQYDLAMQYSDRLLKENPSGPGACKAIALKLLALYKNQRFDLFDQQASDGINTCMKAGEPIYSSFVRVYVAERNLDQGHAQEALRLLEGSLAATRATRYPPIILFFDAMLARAYLETNDPVAARQSALEAIDHVASNQFSEGLVAAYRVLYLVEEGRGDLQSALEYHKKYMATDKGYLNEISARALAYQTVKQQVLAKKLQVDTLAKQNKILQLQQALSEKAVEAGRLWIILLALLLCFIGFITYRIKRSQLKFMKLARRDGLTGIFNRQHFVGEAERLLQYCRKSDRAACLVLLDLDHFKQVNDTHGHAVGDRVLRRAVAACQAHLRSTDLFGRLGGEEFGVLLPECELDQTLARVEQIRLAIASVSLGEDAPNVAVSASFGVATVANSGYELRQLMTDADDALYEAKREGRNRVNLSSSRHVQLSLV